MEKKRTLVRFVDQETGKIFVEGLMTQEQIDLLHWLMKKSIMYDTITFSVQEKSPEIV